MAFIQISPNVLLNTRYITSIQQRREKGRDVCYVVCDGKEYEYDNEKQAPVAFFISLLQETESKQKFAL